MSKMKKTSGGNRSGKPRRMVPDPTYAFASSRETGKLTSKDLEAAAVVLNPGKTVDVSEMAMGGYMDDEVAEKMMGGYMNYKDK